MRAITKSVDFELKKKSNKSGFSTDIARIVKGCGRSLLQIVWRVLSSAADKVLKT